MYVFPHWIRPTHVECVCVHACVLVVPFPGRTLRVFLCVAAIPDWSVSMASIAGQVPRSSEALLLENVFTCPARDGGEEHLLLSPHREGRESHRTLP